MQMDIIIDAVKQALSHRDSRRDILAERIADLAADALSATRKSSLDLGATGRLEYRNPAADCSQWSNRVDHPGHIGRAVLMLCVGEDVRSLGQPPDLGFHDGRNMQAQQGPTRDAKTGRVLRPATVAQLKAVAVVLPAALAALLKAEQERAEDEVKVADEAFSSLDR